MSRMSRLRQHSTSAKARPHPDHNTLALPSMEHRHMRTIPNCTWTEAVIPIEALIHTERVSMVTDDENKDSRRLDLALAEETPFGKHLEDKHVTWARFGKKLDKNITF
ncbi:hypothetical protein Tco_0237176 [Tanacetum coccineum]